ncbi:MAG: hypothetical protein JWQ78_2237, partial [Sediminibacterium sp.]|nr:hypothetical protein [Sediminibacterium sp.]
MQLLKFLRGFFYHEQMLYRLFFSLGILQQSLYF